MGRQPQPAALLDLKGTRQKCRHGAADDGWIPDEPPVQLVRLTGEAAKFWDHIVGALAKVGIAVDVDSAELLALCEHWAEWVAIRAALSEMDCTDIPYYRLQIQAGQAWNLFHKSAIHFGMTPAARMKLKGVGSAVEVEDPMDLLLPGKN